MLYLVVPIKRYNWRKLLRRVVIGEDHNTSNAWLRVDYKASYEWFRKDYETCYDNCVKTVRDAMIVV